MHAVRSRDVYQSWILLGQIQQHHVCLQRANEKVRADFRITDLQCKTQLLETLGLR